MIAMPSEVRSDDTMPATKTMSTALVARIRASIMRGDLIPGAKLNLDRLRESFGVSLSPLREALCRLESDGLVTVVDQRGYRVTSVSDENLAEVTQLRVKLECWALKEAMAHGDVAWEGRVLAVLHTLSRCKGGSRSAVEQEEWEAAHRAFHSELISACGMPLLRQFCATLHDQSDRYRRIFLKKNPPDRDVPAEHAAIAQLVIERRSRQAIEMLREHIERTGRNVQAALKAIR
jgi:GntR family transcriptional regulator, carbon starvation induced regulator